MKSERKAANNFFFIIRMIRTRKNLILFIFHHYFYRLYSILSLFLIPPLENHLLKFKEVKIIAFDIPLFHELQQQQQPAQQI